MKAGILAEPVLVGRKRELEQLESFLDSALKGKGKTVFVSGEAGSGKSKLVREFLKAAAKRGVGVMTGWCLSDSAAPYFPFVEAFNAFFSSFDEEEPSASVQPGTALGLAGAAELITKERGITAWLTETTWTEKTGKPGAVSPQVWKDQVYAGVAKTLHTISAEEPLVLFIEDLHWADSASLALLNYVARTVNESERILVLATFRPEELTADTEGRPHPLSELMRLMRREDLFSEIKLSGLDKRTVSELAENMIGGTLEPKLAEKLATESRGNPLFVVESLRMLHERKNLLMDNNEWRLEVEEIGIPTRIKDVILSRLATLKYAQRRVLDAASVIGEKFDAELLSTVLQLDSLEVLEALNSIGHSTSLVNAEENFYRFDHATSRQTLYQELSPPLKRGYHARIAENLENTRDAALPLSDLAYHFAQAGNKEKGVKYALAAGKDDLAKWSNEQAIVYFRYALQNVSEGQPEEKRAALEGLGDAYAANSMYAEAIKIFDGLAASETGVGKLRALRKATDAAYGKGDRPDLLIEYAKKAEEVGMFDPLEMARIINNRGHAWAWVGHGGFKDDLADFDTALKVFEEENSLSDTAEALMRSGLLSIVFQESREKGLGGLLRSVAIFRELGDIRKEITATLHLGEGFGMAGLLPEEKAQYTKVLGLGEKLGAFDELAIASVFLAEFDEEEGKVSDALSQSLKALEFSQKTDADYVQGIINVTLARQYILLGDLKHANEYLARTSKLSSEKSTPTLTYENALTNGMYLAAKGRWEESNQIFEEFRKRGEELAKDENSRFPSSTAFAMRAVAWTIEMQGDKEKAKEFRNRAKQVIDEFEQDAEVRFGHAKVQVSLMVPRKVQVGEKFEMRFDLVNISRRPGAISRIEGAVPREFKVSSGPHLCNKEGAISLGEKSIEGFTVETIKLALEATKTGTYDLSPEVFYTDDLGKTKTFKANPITITAQPAKLEFETVSGRVSTGTTELDRLLLGGIPEGYAVILSAPSSDERQLLIKHFLEAGADQRETTLYVTCEGGKTQDLAKKFPNLALVMCNLQADRITQSLPNIYALKGVENLTELDILLTKYFRAIDPSLVGSKRACVDIISDVLLQHHAVTTRKWLNGLLVSLKSEGFTTLAVIDPSIHSTDEVQAILGLFDGEIRISEKESATGVEKTLKIRKLYNQQYSVNEIALTKEKMR